MRQIPLTQGKVAMVSDKDYARVNVFKWSALKTNWGNWYARRIDYSTGNSIYMHRFILGITDTKVQVDHAPDFNGLNNQRSNLRRTNNAGNQQHKPKGNYKGFTSKFKGVSLYKRTPKWWIAHIQVKGKVLHLGYFLDPKEAAKAYDTAARRLHGRFACTNKMLGLL